MTRSNIVENLLFNPPETSMKSIETCKNCKKPGHIENECWLKFSEKRPKQNLQTRSITSNNNNNGNLNTTTRKDIKCHFCGRLGHELSDCRTLAKYSRITKEEQKARAKLYRTNCKKNGHDINRRY